MEMEHRVDERKTCPFHVNIVLIVFLFSPGIITAVESVSIDSLTFEHSQWRSYYPVYTYSLPASLHENYDAAIADLTGLSISMEGGGELATWSNLNMINERQVLYDPDISTGIREAFTEAFYLMDQSYGPTATSISNFTKQAKDKYQYAPTCYQVHNYHPLSYSEVPSLSLSRDGNSRNIV